MMLLGLELLEGRECVLFTWSCFRPALKRASADVWAVKAVACLCFEQVWCVDIHAEEVTGALTTPGGLLGPSEVPGLEKTPSQCLVSPQKHFCVQVLWKG